MANKQSAPWMTRRDWLLSPCTRSAARWTREFPSAYAVGAFSRKVGADPTFRGLSNQVSSTD